MIRVLLAGQRSFGRAVYQMLLDTPGVEVTGVISPADSSDRLTNYALSQGEDWFEKITPQAVNFRDVDLIVAAHSHDYIGRKSRAASRLGAIGYHPSLLPRHRGRDAVEWTVRMRDPIAGGTVYWFNDGVDTGPIAAQDWCHVDPRWSASDLWRERLFPMGLELTQRVVQQVERGELWMTPQDETFATWEPALGVPPLYRPELPELGSPAGYAVKVEERYTGARR